VCDKGVTERQARCQPPVCVFTLVPLVQQVVRVHAGNCHCYRHRDSCQVVLCAISVLVTKRASSNESIEIRCVGWICGERLVKEGTEGKGCSHLVDICREVVPLATWPGGGG
jgi:hypothetical protein